jgi:hypothetical protein
MPGSRVRVPPFPPNTFSHLPLAHPPQHRAREIAGVRHPIHRRQQFPDLRRAVVRGHAPEPAPAGRQEAWAASTPSRTEQRHAVAPLASLSSPDASDGARYPSRRHSRYVARCVLKELIWESGPTVVRLMARRAALRAGGATTKRCCASTNSATPTPIRSVPGSNASTSSSGYMMLRLGGYFA